MFGLLYSFTPSISVNRRILFFLPIILLFFLAGCNNSTTSSSPDATFSGHIVNPTSEFLVLSKDANIVDTSYLTEEDNFSFHIKNAEEGLYNFRHGYETQVIYLSPGDSLLMWGNTLLFDESLHFSGDGAPENNYLINLFLRNEKNSDLVLDYYKIEPKEFGAIVDSIKQHRQENLDNLIEEHNVSENFVEVAQKMIQYENNNLKEQYAYLVNKYFPEFSEDFPEEFFDYRDDLSFNEKSFQSNPTYLRFLDNYLINLSMKDCTGDPHVDPCYDQNNFANISKRIELIDSLTSLPLIKNYFLNRLGTAGMVMGKNREELRGILKTLQEKGIPDDDLDDLVTLGSIQLAFIPGINVSNIPLVSADGTHLESGQIFNGRTIFYLWSINSPTHHKNQHQKIDELEEKYPEINFSGINIDIGETSAWQNALRKYHYDLKNEYQLDAIEIRGNNIGSEVFNSYLNKLLFIDATGTVVIGDAYLDSPDFESRILEFLNL